MKGHILIIVTTLTCFLAGASVCDAKSKLESDADTAVESSSEASSSIRAGQYRGRPAGTHPGSLTAGLLALGPGAVFHGLGHFHIGQEERGLALLATEAAGLSLVILSDVLHERSAGTDETARFESVLAQSGWALFFGSWFADMIGASRGTRPFDTIKSPGRQTSFHLGYAYLNAENLGNEHLVDLSLSTMHPYFGFGVQHSQGLESGSWLSQVEGDLRLSDPQLGYVGLGLRAGHSSRYHQRWSFFNYTPMLKWAIDLGVVMSSLRNAKFLGHFGYGESGYVFDETGVDTIWGTKQLWMPRFLYKTALKFSLSPKFVTEIGLLHDDAQWVGPTRFQPTEVFVPRTMLLEGKVNYRYRGVNLQLGILSGDGQQVSIGLEYLQ